jgi:dodecin
MAVARITQIIGASPHSWEDAVHNALKRANKTAEPGGPGQLPAQGSHRSGRARLAHPAPQVMGLLRDGNPVVHPVCYPWESR